MQDEKEDSTGSLAKIKEKVRDWSSRHFLAARCSVYPFLLVLWFVSFIPAFRWFNLFNTEATSARYMLSALVQSQAAIVAIVISLTLVAVQLTASAYSPRVIDVFKSFKKNPDFWILLGFYGFSIFYGLFILKLVKATEGEFVNQSAIWPSFHPLLSLEHGVSMAYWLGIFTFIILVPYLWNILDLLKPENIINRLKIDITKDTLLNSEEDPIQPITDIVHGSIMKYDIETTRVGLGAVTERLSKIIDQDSQIYISSFFCSRLIRIGRHAISQANEDATIEVIVNLGNFGESTAGKKIRDATNRIVSSLEEIGIAAAEKGLVVATRRAVDFLEFVGATAAEKGLEKVTGRAVKSLERVGRASAEKSLEGATRQVAVSLGEVGSAAAGKGLENAAWDAAEFLEAFGKVAMEKDLGDTAFEVIESLRSVGRITTEKGLETATGRVVKALLAVRQIAEKVVASNLAGLTIISEEIVKTAIQNYKSKLEEQDRDSFQKFMKIYEQKLGELRAEQRNAE